MKALLTEGRLKPHPFLDGCSHSFLNHLEEFATEKQFEPGEVVLQEGEYADRCYLILDGRVALESRGNGGAPVRIQIVGAGELLGWSWLYAPFLWHFTARALESVTTLELNAASLLVRAEEDPAFGYELMKRVSHQLIQRLEKTRELLVAQLKAGPSHAPLF
jgi:CRP/FNR family transcriptional regulator, cyclic AMP receptor protein